MPKQGPGPCERCGHDFDPHAVIALYFEEVVLKDGHQLSDYPTGGVILCPQPGCLCQSTWSIGHPSFPRHDVMPPEDELAKLRAIVQTAQLL